MTIPEMQAAQYLRISTGRQSTSLAGQAEMVERFANRQGITIGRTYFDLARSGLTTAGRLGFRQMLLDVRSKERTFSLILVPDISRWGRFQNPDQAAAYEFFCRDAGVEVLYVQDEDINPDDFGSSVIKHLRRMMAAEYSRELSDKVFRAHLTQAGLGYFQGGPPIYGFRRVLLSPAGGAKVTMSPGERKYSAMDRVTLALGPQREVRTIKMIFKAFVVTGQTIPEIVRHLNQNKVPAADESCWTFAKVRQVLKNDLVVGDYVYNRTSQKLAAQSQRNHESEWVRVRVGPAIVSTTLFDRAAELLGQLSHCSSSDQKMIVGLARLLKQKGRLSQVLIDVCPRIPSASTYANRFGSLQAAYEKVGYRSDNMVARKRRYFGHLSDAKLLAGLRDILQREGRITAALIKSDPRIPGIKYYERRFGTLRNVYNLAGFTAGL